MWACVTCPAAVHADSHIFFFSFLKEETASSTAIVIQHRWFYFPGVSKIGEHNFVSSGINWCDKVCQEQERQIGGKALYRAIISNDSHAR